MGPNRLHPQTRVGNTARRRASVSQAGRLPIVAAVPRGSRARASVSAAPCSTRTRPPKPAPTSLRGRRPPGAATRRRGRPPARSIRRPRGDFDRGCPGLREAPLVSRCRERLGEFVTNEVAHLAHPRRRQGAQHVPSGDVVQGVPFVAVLEVQGASFAEGDVVVRGRGVAVRDAKEVFRFPVQDRDPGHARLEVRRGRTARRREPGHDLPVSVEPRLGLLVSAEPLGLGEGAARGSVRHRFRDGGRVGADVNPRARGRLDRNARLAQSVKPRAGSAAMQRPTIVEARGARDSR